MAIISCLSCWPVATYSIWTYLEKMLKAKNVITLPPDIGIKRNKHIKTRSDLSDCRFVNKFLTFCRKENVELSDDVTTILFISSIIIFGDSSNPSIFSTPRNHLRETTASSGRFLHIWKITKSVCNSFQKFIVKQFSKLKRLFPLSESILQKTKPYGKSGRTEFKPSSLGETILSIITTAPLTYHSVTLEKTLETS